MTPLVIGVTSHRNLSADEIEPIRARVRELFAYLTHEFPGLSLVAMSSLAEGGDQLFAAEALAAGARLVVPLPLPKEMYAEDFKDPDVRDTFSALCDRADTIRLPLLKSQSREALQTAGEARDRQYAKAGVFIASHSHIMVAIWDGNDSGRLGGTGQIVKYYLHGTLPGIIEHHRQARHVLGGGDEHLLYHIACSRVDAEQPIAQGVAPLEARWLTGNEASSLADMPADFHLMFRHMVAFNDDCEKYRDTVEETCGRHATEPVEELFHFADWLALHFQKRVLMALRVTFTLAALMGIAFTFYAHLQAQNSMIYLFLLLFAIGGIVAILARRREWHRKYLDYRALAEGLRIQSYWRKAGISKSTDHEFAHDNFLQKQNIELGWIRNVMRAMGLHPPSRPTPEALDAVINEWVGESGKSGQLHYFERKTLESSGLHHITETIGLISLWAGVAISAFLAIFALRLPETTKTMLVMAMAMLSIIAAVREAYAYRKADKELIRQYRFMERIFKGARAAIDRTRDPGERRDILRSLGDAALTEHAEWTLMHRERQVEHSKF
ncbi:MULTISPECIES: DUF4231 domain-containing protein [Dyella]|uniref:SMODS and SLOG-associating 2TM effector domain-containing protein n=2 Tax=Dyella TaxID=231454 RepID=A0A4R0YWS5_9GAMM|nr:MULTISPECIES: DUF4231 domain-containing protein [Dyella]TBR39392.1 hypothetical protein EYV96_04010 [Dyella terrae]TCI13021.1 hypothetical protein EZM97_06855 [Dyella soli]